MHPVSHLDLDLSAVSAMSSEQAGAAIRNVLVFGSDAVIPSRDVVVGKVEEMRTCGLASAGSVEVARTRWMQPLVLEGAAVLTDDYAPVGRWGARRLVFDR